MPLGKPLNYPHESHSHVHTHIVIYCDVRILVEAAAPLLLLFACMHVHVVQWNPSMRTSLKCVHVNQDTSVWSQLHREVYQTTPEMRTPQHSLSCPKGVHNREVHHSTVNDLFVNKYHYSRSWSPCM